MNGCSFELLHNGLNTKRYGYFTIKMIIDICNWGMYGIISFDAVCMGSLVSGIISKKVDRRTYIYKCRNFDKST